MLCIFGNSAAHLPALHPEHRVRGLASEEQNSDSYPNKISILSLRKWFATELIIATGKCLVKSLPLPVLKGAAELCSPKPHPASPREKRQSCLV